MPSAVRNLEARITAVQRALGERSLDAILVTNLVNVRYLCGFTGSAGALVIGKHEAVFVSDGRYRYQASIEVRGASIMIAAPSQSVHSLMRPALSRVGGRRVAFEAQSVSVAQLEQMRRALDDTELASEQGMVEVLRRSKDSLELADIRRAASLADAGLDWVGRRIAPGKTEQEIALDLEMFVRRQGAEDVSFEVIVASGERSAMPHARPSSAKIRLDEFVLVDMGCKVNGYCSDITRTFMLGEASDTNRRIYDAVRRAQQSALEEIGPGKSGAEIDGAARKIIETEGYGDHFPHGVGHGVGLEIHEAPLLSGISGDVLKAGDIVTVEPGVYIQGFGGVRIEDLVAVTATGYEVLSEYPKDMVVIGP